MAVLSSISIMVWCPLVWLAGVPGQALDVQPWSRGLPVRFRVPCRSSERNYPVPCGLRHCHRRYPLRFVCVPVVLVGLWGASESAIQLLPNLL